MLGDFPRLKCTWLLDAFHNSVCHLVACVSPTIKVGKTFPLTWTCCYTILLNQVVQPCSENNALIHWFPSQTISPSNAGNLRLPCLLLLHHHKYLNHYESLPTPSLKWVPSQFLLSHSKAQAPIIFHLVFLRSFTLAIPPLVFLPSNPSATLHTDWSF